MDKPLVNRVETTNDCSILSKASMCAKGYAQDKYLHLFVTPTSTPTSTSPTHHGRSHNQIPNRSPLINRGYYLRHKAMEWALEKNKDISLIISLGCGFDTSPLRLMEHSTISFIEIDFHDVIRRKRDILMRNGYLKQEDLVENSYNDDEAKIMVRNERHTLIGADLRKLDQLRQLFLSVNLISLPSNSIVGILNECSLCYIERIHADNLISLFHQLCSCQKLSLTYMGYEQYLAPQNSSTQSSPFASVMISHFNTIGSPIVQFMDKENDANSKVPKPKPKPKLINPKENLISRFKSLSFDSVQVIDMSMFYHDILPSSERERISGLEMFDEYEEFDLLCNAYALTIAKYVEKDSASNLDNATSTIITNDIDSKDDFINASFKSNSFKVHASLHRYAQASCLANDNQIFIYGGFGCDTRYSHDSTTSYAHKRLNNIVKVNTSCNDDSFNCAQNYTIYYDESQNQNAGRLHSRLAYLDQNTLFLSGGRLSPQKVMQNAILRLNQEEKSFKMQSICGSSHEIEVPNVFRHSLTHLSGNKLLQIGGLRQSAGVNETYSGTSFIYDLIAMKWLSMKLDNDKRHSHSCCLLNENMTLYHGGLSTIDNSFMNSDITLIDLRSQQTSTLVIPYLQSLYSHHIKSLNDNKVYIIGGVSKQGNHMGIHAVSLDLRQNKIISKQNIDLSDAVDDDGVAFMPNNFACQMLNTTEGNVLLQLCGGGNCFSFGTHFNKHMIKTFVDSKLN